MALGVVMVLLGGMVGVIGVVTGGSAPDSASGQGASTGDGVETPVDVPAPSDPTDVPVTSGPTDVPGTSGTTDASGASDQVAGPPTPADPAKVLIVGDSDAGTFGPYLEQLLRLTGVVTSTLDYKVSSGLTRPDFYDWPARFQEQIPLVNPDIVVVTFGGNDAQPIRVDGQLYNVDAPEWTTEYRRRVGEVLDHLTADGRTVIWVGIPNASSESFTARLQVQRDAVVAELAERPEVFYVDTWERFSGRSGGYADYVIDPRDGMGKDVRAGDGFHLNVTGAEILALDIAEVVRAELRTRGAAI
jgi:uncharacterized protein